MEEASISDGLQALGSCSSASAGRPETRHDAGHDNVAYKKFNEINDDETLSRGAICSDNALVRSNAADAMLQEHPLSVESTEIEDLIASGSAHDLDPLTNNFDVNDDSSAQRHNAFIDTDEHSMFIKHSIIIICDVSKLVTPVGLLKIATLVSCIVSLACVCGTDYPALVLSGYARFHIFSLTFTFLTVLVVFLLEILTLLLLFPVHWAHWNAFIHLVVFLLLTTSSSLLMHSLIANESLMPRLDMTVEFIVICVLSGYFGSLLCLLISLMACCCYEHHMTLPWKQHPTSVLLLK